MSEGMLTTLGLAELVAGDAEGYVRIAVELARDLSRLGALHAGLRRMLQDSPFCDGPRFARALDAAYRDMWRVWCAGEPS
jgi:protein O-GlcNAc transferase